MVDKSDLLREKLRKKAEAAARAEEHSQDWMFKQNEKILESTEMGKHRKVFLDQFLVSSEMPRSYSEERESELGGLPFEKLLRVVQELTDREKGWQDPEEYFLQKLPVVRYALTGAFSLAVTGLIVALLYAAGFSLEAATDGVGVVLAWTASIVCTLAAAAAGGVMGYGLGCGIRDSSVSESRDLWPFLLPLTGALLPGYFVWPRVWHFMTRPLSRSLYFLADAAWAGIIFLFVLIFTIGLDLPRHLFHLACRNHRGLRSLVEDHYTDMLRGPEGQDLMIIAGSYGRILSAASKNSWKASPHYREYASYMEEIRVLDEEIEEIRRMQRP